VERIRTYAGTTQVNAGTLWTDSTITNVMLTGSGQVTNVGTISNAILDASNFGLFANAGTITTATLKSNASALLNALGGTINTTIVDAGGIWNCAGSTINAATINNDGAIENAGTIGTVSLNARYGGIGNLGQIDNLTYTSGLYEYRIDRLIENLTSSGYPVDSYPLFVGANVNDFTDGTINTLTVNGNATGIDWGNLVTATVNNGGVLENVSGNTIGSARVNAGTLANSIGSTISNATISGGTVSNAGSITALTYNSGSYSGTGSLGTVTIAGNSIGINWGNANTVNINSTGTLDSHSLSTYPFQELRLQNWCRESDSEIAVEDGCFY